MIGVYFSGTGNTKYCIEKFFSLFDNTAEIFALETAEALKAITQHQDIILAYPVYYSNLPKIVRDFITENSDIWKEKRIFIIATMGLFSGDGAGLSARLLKKYGAQITGGLHVKMPDCICDVKALKRTYSQNKQIIEQANEKLILAAQKLKDGKATKEGLGFFYHLAGLFGQRLYFSNKTRQYSDKLRIDTNSCVGCGRCVTICPMNNITLYENKAIASNLCTMCYRCINQCTQKSITLLGSKVIEQHSVSDFLCSSVIK